MPRPDQTPMLDRLFPPALPPRLRVEYERTHSANVMVPLILLGLFGLISVLSLYALNPEAHGHVFERLRAPFPATLLVVIALAWLAMIWTSRDFKRFSLACLTFLGAVYGLEAWLVQGDLEMISWMLPTFLVWSLAFSPLTIRPRTFLSALGITVLTPILLTLFVKASLLLWLTMLLHLAAISCVATMVFRTVNKSRRENFIARVSLREAAWRDSLTTLLTRRRFFEKADLQLALARRLRLPISACFLDLDDFKRINDVLGHAVGDEVLARAAAVLAELDRGGDDMPDDALQILVARMGGEEFALLLPGQTLAEAERLANALIAAIREDRDDGLRVRASAGVAELCAEEELSELLHHADLALLQAKHDGKDRVVAFRPGDVAEPPVTSREAGPVLSHFAI